MVQAVNNQNPLNPKKITTTNDNHQKKGFAQDIKDGDKKSMTFLYASGVALAAAVAAGTYAYFSSKPEKIIDKALEESKVFVQGARKAVEELFNDFEDFTLKNFIDGAKCTGGRAFKPKMNNKNLKIQYVENGLDKPFFEILDLKDTVLAKFEENSKQLIIPAFPDGAELVVTFGENVEKLEKEALKTNLKSYMVRRSGIGSDVIYQYDYDNNFQLKRILKTTTGDRSLKENIKARLVILFNEAGTPKHIIKNARNAEQRPFIEGKKIYIYNNEAKNWSASKSKKVLVDTHSYMQMDRRIDSNKIQQQEDINQRQNLYDKLFENIENE